MFLRNIHSYYSYMLGLTPTRFDCEFLIEKYYNCDVWFLAEFNLFLA